MTEENSAALQAINAAVLTPIVRQSVQEDSLRIQTWQVRQLGGGAGNPVSVGLYRFAGSGQAADNPIHWSVVLKIIQSPANAGLVNFGEGADQTHWNYWKREPLLYRSGLLETLPEGLTAPRCFGITEMPGDVIWMWLEDVADAYAGAWSLEGYALTARRLGRLNGVYLAERPLPPYPWFSRRRIQQWIDLVPWRTLSWEHPQVRAHYTGLEHHAFRQMLVENARFLARLEQLPQTLCHGDTYPTNFMARRLPAGQDQTVALDWALAGIAPVGADLGQLVFGAQTNLKESNPNEVDAALFESYLDGLKDSGCRVDPRLVRFGYTAFAALQVGLFRIVMLSQALAQSAATPGQAPAPAAASDCFEVDMAGEACQLLETIQGLSDSVGSGLMRDA